MLTAEQIVRVLDPLPPPKGSVERAHYDSIEARASELRRAPNSYFTARIEWLEAQMKEWGGK